MGDNSVEQVKQDTERDNYMTAAEAKDYGLIDKVIVSRQNFFGGLYVY